MQIDPETRKFSEVADLEAEVTQAQLRQAADDYREKVGNDLIIAQSDSEAQLKKLQNDLRKAGYRKANFK